jgi:hypothetical protein
MTKLIQMDCPRIVKIEAESEHQRCQLCGKEAETRPYGSNGEEVCFQCGMKDEETTKRQFGRILLGDVGSA